MANRFLRPPATPGVSFTQQIDVDSLPLEINNAAFNLGISPIDLAKAISYETAGTFDKAKKGPVTKWGRHEGLIQWGQPQQRQYGVDVNGPSDEQMVAVQQYLRDAGVKPGMGLPDIYSAINAGQVGRYNASDRPGKTVRTHVAAMDSHEPGAAMLLGQGTKENRFLKKPAAPVAAETPGGGFLDNMGRDASEVASAAVNAWTQDPRGAAAETADYLLNPITYLKSVKESVGNLWEGGTDRAYEKPVTTLLDAVNVLPPTANIAVKAANVPGKAIAKTGKYVVGETSGAGPMALEEAYRAGRLGGTQGQKFREGMRGKLDPDEPVDVARGALGELKEDRKAAYLASKGGPGGWARSNVRLSWGPVEAAYNAGMGIKRFRGKDLKPSVAAARGKVRAALDEWRNDPASWSVEGFDALKQRLQDIQQNLDPSTEGAARAMIGNVTSEIKKQIKNADPKYAKAMKMYEEASRTIDEIQRSLSLNDKATYDTALRKLQSILRNNAFTNWGGRAKLAKLLEQKAPELMPMLSGQALNAFMPRGLGKLIGAGGVGAAGLSSGAALLANPSAWLPVAAAMGAASPRILGEITHGLGRARGVIDRYGGAFPSMAAELFRIGQEQ